MGPLGVQEMLAIFVIALLLFGPKKLPELGRMLGKALSEFRRAKNELKSTFESHLSELEREVDAEKQLTAGSEYSPMPYSHADDEAAPHESAYDPTSPAYAAPQPAGNGISENHEGNESHDDTARPSGEAVEHAPIAGTVPRSNGIPPVGFPATEQERSA